MKHYYLPAAVLCWLLVFSAGSANSQAVAPVIRRPAAVMLTAYNTTLIANGRNSTSLRIALIDSLSREIPMVSDSVRIYLDGEGAVVTGEGKALASHRDTAGKRYYACKLYDGVYRARFIAGRHPGKTKIEARSGSLWPGSHEIHLLPARFVCKKPAGEIPSPVGRPVGKMIGADISWLPELEARGRKFYEDGREKDAILILRDHGFNYIRLRIFVDPANKDGYSPGKGFCGLSQTLAMARRISEAGMRLLLDFHYSDYWADPQQQNKPLAWSKLDYKTLADSVRTYTTYVLTALQRQGTPATMVQVGNEINHGILWPEGHISQPDQLAGLLKAGVEGVRAADKGMPVMMHLALGGQNEEAVFWLDNMIARGVTFDILGLSYYPRWHGTPDDLKRNIGDLAARYRKPVNIVEYSDFKEEVFDIIFSLPGGYGRGACIWEPLNPASGLFTKMNEATDLFGVYDRVKEKYLSRP